MLESVEDIGAETLVVVFIFLVGDVLHEYGGVEIDDGAWHTLRAVGGEVHRGEGTIGAVASADHCHTLPSAGMGVEPICLLTRHTVFHFHQVWGKHCIPLTVDVIGEDGPFITPLTQILHRSRPHTDVGSAILREGHIVGTDDVGTKLPGIVGIFKNAGFTIGHMFPKREVGILCRNRQTAEQSEEQ